MRHDIPCISSPEKAAEVLFAKVQVNRTASAHEPVPELQDGDQEQVLQPLVLQPTQDQEEMMYDTFLGVDPGLAGGIAIMSPNGIAAHKMPETERDIWEFFHGIPILRSFALIERVHSMPGQGVSSSFKFGMGYGALRMALVASGIPFEDVTPQKWQKALGCLSGGDKNVTKQRAQSLFPHIKVTHAIADSLLIAEFCKRTHRP